MAQISPSPTAPASCSFFWEPPQPLQPWLPPTPCFPMPAVHHPLPIFTSTWTSSLPAPFPTPAGSTYASCLHTQCTPHQVARASTPSPPLPAASISLPTPLPPSKQPCRTRTPCTAHHASSQSTPSPSSSYFQSMPSH